MTTTPSTPLIKEIFDTNRELLAIERSYAFNRKSLDCNLLPVQNLFSENRLEYLAQLFALQRTRAYERLNLRYSGATVESIGSDISREKVLSHIESAIAKTEQELQSDVTLQSLENDEELFALKKKSREQYLAALKTLHVQYESWQQKDCSSQRKTPSPSNNITPISSPPMEPLRSPPVEIPH